MANRVLVIGLGVTGLSVGRYLQSKNQAFMFYDTRVSPPRLAEFRQHFPDVDIYCQDFPSSAMNEIASIITSPGVAPDTKLLRDAKVLGLKIENDLDCLAKEISTTPLIAITGSNGKSTVTTWIGEIAKSAGLKVAVGGNLGTPVLDLLLAHDDYDLWVLELSSFQLAALHHLNILIGVNLNVSPDHLDVHGSLENYIAAKQQIFAFAKHGVFNREDKATLPQFSLEKQASFGLNPPTNEDEWGVIAHEREMWIACGKTAWLRTKDLKLQGQHHWQNAMATAAALKLVGMDFNLIQQGLKEFGGLHHRTEWVAEIAGVTYINDSKGTNMGATQAAVQGIGATISGKIVLIAGGLSKGADLSPLCPLLQTYVKNVVLIGQDAPILADAWQSAVDISHCQSLSDALEVSRGLAQAGDVVLLSPACASFDMFKGYEDRGQQFVNIVQGWMK